MIKPQKQGWKKTPQNSCFWGVVGLELIFRFVGFLFFFCAKSGYFWKPCKIKGGKMYDGLIVSGTVRDDLGQCFSNLFFGCGTHFVNKILLRPPSIIQIKCCFYWINSFIGSVLILAPCRSLNESTNVYWLHTHFNKDILFDFLTVKDIFRR